MNFAGFKLRVGLVGADDGASGGSELVDDACDEGSFGSDDGEVGVYGGCSGEKILGGEAGSDLGNARIAGCGEDLMAFRSQAPSEGVFAASAAKDKNFQGQCPF